MIGYGRGGGGFGGFPYRSSHQQGQDGRGNNRGGRGGGQRKQSKPRSQNNNMIVASELDIPSDQRKIVVGKGGTTLKWLKEVSGANIFVPRIQEQNHSGCSAQQEADTNADGISSQEQATQHPVRVNSSDGLLSILHAFEEISILLSKSSDINADFIPCVVKLKTNNITTQVDGKLFLQRSVAADTSIGRRLFSGIIPSDSTMNELHAYSIDMTAFDEDSVSMLVDNILFADSSLERVHWYYKQTTHRNSNIDNNIQTMRRIVFVFGSERDNTNLFFDALKVAVSAAENNVPFS